MHRPTGETVLMYGFKDPQRTRELQYIMVQMGIRVKTIHDDQLGQTVGYLAGVKDMEENPNPEQYPPFEKEVMVMHNFSITKRIDMMLSNIKKRGLEGIPLKCVLTSTNKKWTFYELAKELEKEHAMILEGKMPGQAEEKAPEEESQN